ncbi:response regulator transcription factor [Paenibacillus sp. B-A-8]|uniref:response regulator transcription factor n=1 Tax=Paenibacillus sp. B-A-8 TaxID=3400419 RepID=UPI003B028C20
MIKVMIVDDEPKLREGLRSLIPWEKLGYTVVATAANGLQAIEKYHTFYPELIVADIRMPGMDGLEMISELRNEGSESHVLILSGHADFEYAKRAIGFRIDGYLLKPVDEDEMIVCLEQLRETIEQEQRFSDWNEEEPARNREALLRTLLQPTSEEETDADLSRHAEALGLEQGDYEVILIELRKKAGANEEGLQQIKTVMEQHFSKHPNASFFTWSQYLGVLMKDPDPSAIKREELYNELSDMIVKMEYDFIAVAGGVVSRPELAGESLSIARELSRRAFFFKKGTIISADASGFLTGMKEETEELQDTESRLLLAVETGSLSAIRPIVQTICAELIAAGSDELRIKETFVRLLSTVLARLEPTYPEIRTYAAEHSPPIGELYQSYYLSDLQDQAVSFLEEIAGQMTSGRGNEIKKITEIINRRYNENLKLETLSELFCYNSAYLGKMFKNTTGEYFNTYVDKVRIEKAKEFLTQGMKVYEVAEKVGYMNPDYFNAKFRKYVGISPTSYRKSI